MSEEKVSLQQQAPLPQPGEAGYTPPATAVPLPSSGRVYPAGSPLAGKEVLEIRAMTARDEDILTSQALVRSGRVLDVLLRSCILDRSIDVGSMLSGDRNAALVAIRITGYGREYRAEAQCPACDERFPHDFDLNTLAVKRLGAEPTSPGSNSFAFVLPVSRKEVVFRLLTGNDELELSQILERSRKVSNGAESLVTTRILHQVVSIGGESDRQKLSGIVANLPARDSRALRKHMAEISPDVDMRQTVTCPSCAQESEVDVPMGTEFFWPQA